MKSHFKNKLSEAPQSKKIALAMVVLTSILLIIPMIAAFEFDNRKEPIQFGDGISDYGKIEIGNSSTGMTTPCSILKIFLKISHSSIDSDIVSSIQMERE